MDMIIFGAQGYALASYNAIKECHPEHNVMFFMVSFMGNNASCLGGLQVRELAAVSDEITDEEKKRIRILIATPENVHDEIEELLNSHGFTDVIRLTSEMWDNLMCAYNDKTRKFPPLAHLSASSSDERNTSIKIYMAKSHKDRPLHSSYELPPFMIPIQVGAANTDDVIADLRDNESDNNSEKNGNYCELTGLYWVWKNILERNRHGADDIRKTEDFPETDREDRLQYFGFAQYRRILMLSDEDLAKLQINDVDAVLPYPLMYEPDISAHHLRYIKDADWDAVLRALRELEPEYAEHFTDILRQQYMFNYNVLLAKREVLMDYCRWLFPILERTEELTEPKGCDRSDRYIGYIGETLETLYFMVNRDKLKTVHTGCRLLR